MKKFDTLDSAKYNWI